MKCLLKLEVEWAYKPEVPLWTVTWNMWGQQVYIFVFPYSLHQSQQPRQSLCQNHTEPTKKMHMYLGHLNHKFHCACSPDLWRKKSPLHKHGRVCEIVLKQKDKCPVFIYLWTWKRFSQRSRDEQSGFQRLGGDGHQSNWMNGLASVLNLITQCGEYS